ncbi:hypothetical protein FV139_11300 [Parahaliea maris]|uniref:DUF4760 domain-containing protein n=1 Tax=Parahaliea maris TaxID=2716870 RepID=A0A5C9A085_9GAMM|nr:hypothetical protein [Parahaliea maris]TXS94176.1 hypothetical protein FV139_11300 [Parahaliea maris]
MRYGDINWDAVGSISEALGAIGVIVTLIYLIRQIKQNTSATRSAAAAAYSQASMTLSKTLSDSVEANSHFYTYLDNPDQLTPEERKRAQAIVSLYIHTMEQAYDLYCEGALTERKWQSRYKQIIWIAQRPGFVEYWQEYGEVYADDFSNYVKRAIEETH